ncbi:hypothetical protein [Idiomarina abyssalis]|uniref:hypothetical protein n=1 Tax=Idiomarina abyssalis TaxID=86102 RepID=UPI003A8F239C
MVIGVAPGSSSPIPNYTMFILKNVAIKGIANGSRAMFVDYINALATNDRKALIAKTFDFDQAPQAYQYFAQAKHIGKVLIKFSYCANQRQKQKREVERLLFLIGFSYKQKPIK